MLFIISEREDSENTVYKLATEEIHVSMKPAEITTEDDRMVFGNLQTDPTLEWFLSHCHIHKYPSKSTLIHQGEKAETLYYIVKGSVVVLIKDEEGREMILSYLNQDDPLLFESGRFHR